MKIDPRLACQCADIACREINGSSATVNGKDYHAALERAKQICTAKVHDLVSQEQL